MEQERAAIPQGSEGDAGSGWESEDRSVRPHRLGRRAEHSARGFAAGRSQRLPRGATGRRAAIAGGLEGLRLIRSRSRNEPALAGRLDCFTNLSLLRRSVLQGATVIVTGISLVSDPEVPISSMVVVPVGARREALQVMVTVVLPLAGGVTGLAEAVAETSVGNSFTLKVTAEWNPFTLVTVRVVDLLPPSSMVKEAGDRDRVKFFVPEEAFTVRETVVL